MLTLPTDPNFQTPITPPAMKQSLNPSSVRLVSGFTVLIERLALALRGAPRAA